MEFRIPMYQNAYTPLQHFRKPNVRTGGLCWAVYARKEDVQLWPQMHPATNLAYTPIKLYEGKTWYQLLAVDKDRILSENMEDSPAGPWWKIQSSCYFGGNNSNHILTSGLLAFDEVVLMIQDRDGNIRLIGNEDAGASFTTAYSSGDKDQSRKRTISFYWEHTMPAAIYIGGLKDIEADVITPPFATLGDFTNDFSDDFFN